MFLYHTPEDIRAPFSHYSHGVEIPGGTRLLVCSGQLGIKACDEIPDDAGEQTVLCFENIGAILRSAKMDYANIVRINAFVTSTDFLKDYMEVRNRYVSDPPPASTLVVVSGFARPQFKVEIEVIAAAQA